MSAILDKARELGQEIANSKELEAMRAAQEKMLEDPEAKNIIQEFEDKQKFYQMLQSQGQSLTDSQKKEAEALEQRMLDNEYILNYFKAQQEFEKIIGGVNDIIAKAITGESHGCECGTSSCCDSCGSGGFGCC